MRNILSRAAVVATVAAVGILGFGGQAQAAVVVGTNHADVITAPQTGPDADSVTAKAGSDHVETYAGNDWVSDGFGNDVVKLGAGNDANTEKGEGSDRVSGGNGSDTVRGGFGPDQLSSGGAADAVYPGAGRDMVSAGEANDLVSVGNDGNRDDINCGDGDDTVAYSSSVVDLNDVLVDCEHVTVTPMTARGSNWD